MLKEEKTVIKGVKILLFLVALLVHKCFCFTNLFCFPLAIFFDFVDSITKTVQTSVLCSYLVVFVFLRFGHVFDLAEPKTMRWDESFLGNFWMQFYRTGTCNGHDFRARHDEIDVESVLVARLQKLLAEQQKWTMLLRNAVEVFVLLSRRSSCHHHCQLHNKVRFCLSRPNFVSVDAGSF